MKKIPYERRRMISFWPLNDADSEVVSEVLDYFAPLYSGKKNESQLLTTLGDLSTCSNTPPTALHNAIKEATGKDHHLMLAPGKYVQWKSRIKRHIDTKPNHELIHLCLKNLPYQYKFLTTDANATFVTLGNEAEAVQIILMRIDNDIYSTVDACPNTMERKFTSHEGESLESYYSRFYKMMNELVRNQCIVTNHQVNVQFLLQLKLEWQRSQAATRNRGKAIVNPPQPTYDPEPKVVADDGASSKVKEIDKLTTLISMSFKKIYKPTNNNLRTSSNTRNTNVDNTPRTNRGTGYDRQTGQYDNQRAVNVVEARKNVGTQEKAGIQLSAEQVDWRDDTDDEPEDQEFEAHYMYMGKIQEATPDAADNSGPIFDDEPLQKVHSSDDNYNVFANERQHLEQPKYVNDTYLVEQGDTNIIHDSSYMSNNGEEADQDDQML
ncbi:hypothetical protein Tco_1475934 [Tanacetum coccineum]